MIWPMLLLLAVAALIDGAYGLAIALALMAAFKALVS